MTGKTHKMGGVLMSVVGFTILKHNDLLLSNVNEGLQWLVMYPFCVWGSVASDIDHHWESCPCRDLPSLVAHKLLHITDPIYKYLNTRLTTSEKKASVIYKLIRFLTPRHRSWQTHSDLTLLSVLYLLYCIVSNNLVIGGRNDTLILNLILTGICLGFISHLILDLLTPEGIWNSIVVVLNRTVCKGNLPRTLEKWHFVPRRSFFATNSSWEGFIYKLLKVLIVISVFYLLFSLILI